MSLFRILTTPRCWLRNHLTNKVLDEWMIEALKEPKFSNYGSFTIDLNGKTIWIENYPYGCGEVYGKAHLGLPSRSTVFKLFDAISNYRTNKNESIL